MQLARSTLTRPAVARARPVAVPARPCQRIAVKASKGSSGMDADELSAKAQELASDLKAKWDKTEDKAGAVVVIGGTVVALSLAFSLVGAVDKIPIVSDLIELVGIGVSGYYLYRYVTVGPDGDELFVSIKDLWKKIYGQF